MLLDQLIDLNILGSYDEITGVGHRVVAGGEEFKDSVVITDEVLEKLKLYLVLFTQPSECDGD